MKKFGSILPVVLMVSFTIYGTKMINSGSIHPAAMIGIGAFLMGGMFLLRPKGGAPKALSEIEEKVRGEFAKDAFADDPALGAKFQAALKDYSGNMPKAALSKLQKLAPQVTGPKEIYAVAMATAMVYTSLNKHRDAIREYIRALNQHQDAGLALNLGSCYQRVGQLEKALDSYEFALDLDPELTEARSKLATAYVADGRYNMGLKHAMTVLDKEETNASALATAAICSALLGDPDMYSHYTTLAVENGYNKDKITQTVDALKKRK